MKQYVIFNQVKSRVVLALLKIIKISDNIIVFSCT
jgi:hypothetical protein